MAITVAKKEELQPVPTTKITGFRRYMVLRAHPISIFWDAATLIWVVYFLWQHWWAYAALLLVVERGFTWIMTQAVDSDALGKTVLGKMALLHLHPVNLTLQLCGVAVAFWGIWAHETIPILSGISLIFLGHTFGWGQVHKALDRGEWSRSAL